MMLITSERNSLTLLATSLAPRLKEGSLWQVQKIIYRAAKFHVDSKEGGGWSSDLNVQWTLKVGKREICRRPLNLN